MTMSRQITYIFLILCGVAGSCVALECLNQDGKATDWFIIYKLPRIDHTDAVINNGTGYVYMTAENIKWVYPNKSITSNGTLLQRTLSHIYQKKGSYLLYNSAPPDHKTNYSEAFSKGIFALDSQGGYWISHSAEEFPRTDNFMLTGRSLKYGQIFFCVSLDFTNLSNLGKQFAISKPSIYHQNVDPSLSKDMANLDHIIHKKPKGDNMFSRVNIVSKNSQTFTHFVKGGKFMKDLYSGLIGPYVKDDLLVESWSFSQKRYYSYCQTKYRVMNVDLIKVEEAGAIFSPHADQARWAINRYPSKMHYVCVGDLIRLSSHKKRGGGAICVNNPRIRGQFEKLVSAIEEC